MEVYCADCECMVEAEAERTDNGHEGWSYHEWTAIFCPECQGDHLYHDEGCTRRVTEADLDDGDCYDED